MLYRSGKENGEFLNWYENGNLESRGNYKDGLVDGVIYYYYAEPANRKHIIRFYQNGKMTVETRFFKNGKKSDEAYFKNGVEYGPWYFWYDNGQKSLEATDSWNGIVTKWYRNGAKQTTGILKNGKEYGAWQVWDSLGNPQKPQIYSSEAKK